jgi:hypothetical protein
VIRDVIAAFAAQLEEHVPLDPASSRVVHLGGVWEDRAVLVVFRPRQPQPSYVIKVDTTATGRQLLEQEFAALRWLRDTRRAPGPVPVPVARFEHRDALVLAQTAVPGRSFMAQLRRRVRITSGAVARDHAVLLGWLEQFRDGGVVAADPGQWLSDCEALTLAEQILPTGKLWARRALDDLRRGADAAGEALRTVVAPSHGDLGPSNVLRHRGRVGVIDWERSHPAAPALNDVLILLHHYARAVSRQRDGTLDTRDVMARAFLHDDALSRETRRRWREQLVALGMPAEADAVVLTATILRFAAGQTPFAQRSGGRMWRQIARRFLRAWSASRPDEGALAHP